MRVFKNVSKFWSTIRWKMLIIFAFFSIISTFLVACFSAAVLNVVIRRESTYLIEERVNGIVDNRKRLTPLLLDQVQGCDTPASNSPLFAKSLDAVWPGSESSITVLPKVVKSDRRPAWLDTGSFAGIVADRDNLEIRSFNAVQREGCSVTILLRIPLGESFAKEVARPAGLQVSSGKPKLLRRFAAHEDIRHVIEANIVPGSSRPLAVVVTARNWQTGLFEDWELCKVRPSYTRILEDLSHVGMRTATWVSLLGAVALALVLVYAAGMLLSIRLSQRIVRVIDGLSQATLQVGKGDFSVRLSVPEQDQLGMLASSFNDMTHDLEILRQQEKQTAVLERDMALAHEVQQYLYPRVTPAIAAANVWGVTTPARMVSGDLYDFLSFSKSDVGLRRCEWEGRLCCADDGSSASSCARAAASFGREQYAAGTRCLCDRAQSRPSRPFRK
jgi:HAMP domain-containing protein